MGNEPMTMENAMATVWEQIQKLKSGDTTVRVANSISGGVATLIRGAMMTLLYAKLTGTIPNLKLLEGSTLPQKKITSEEN